MTVLHYIEKTAQDFPDKKAIIDEYGSYTFVELRDSALSIAACIEKKLNGKTHQPILVYLPKRKECVAAFMGIVYSRNIYTPVGIRFPFLKIQGIIEVLKPALYISDRKNAIKLCNNGIPSNQIVIYEDIESAAFDSQKALSRTIDTDPVYVFFTSGSTGKPKGVTISHRGIVDYIDWVTKRFNISEQEIIGNQAPLYFDLSTPDIYLCLKTGAQMNLIPENLFAFPTRLVQYLKDKDINFISWVPSALCHVANHEAFNNTGIPNLKKILFCGEVMPNKQLNYWRLHLPDALYVNLYGPTEITVAGTYYIVEREFEDNETLPIGYPCENTDILLIDDQNHLVTTSNVQGEICVRGSSLSHGYWNNPHQTAEVFCQNPFNLNFPEKIYRTGDLAYYNNRSELIFSGRKDFQIKHLGHRIELGEIEVAAMSLDNVIAASADYDNARHEIVLFYSGTHEYKTMQMALVKLLPKYMVPTRYIQINKFPYNDNSKIDRLQLRKEYIEV